MVRKSTSAGISYAVGVVIEFESLNENDKERVVNRGYKWRLKYKRRVAQLISAADGHCYPPSGSDLNHPELWKPAHWRWFYEAELERRLEKKGRHKMVIYVTDKCHEWLTRRKGSYGATRNKIVQTVLETIVDRDEEIEREKVWKK